MSWWVKSRISSQYLILIFWFNLNTWIKSSDSTQILELRILTWIKSWRVKYLTWTQVLDLTRSVYWQVQIQDSENLVSWIINIHQWFMNELLKSRCDLKLKSVLIIDSYADLYWLLQFLLMIHKELLKDCSIYDKADLKKLSFWMN